MWRAHQSTGGSASVPASGGRGQNAGSKMRTAVSVPSSSSSPFKSYGSTVPIPGRGDVKVFAPDPYKYKFPKDASGTLHILPDYHRNVLVFVSGVYLRVFYPLVHPLLYCVIGGLVDYI